MANRAYISNLSPSWPPELQEVLLAARVPGWPVSIYRDHLKPRHLRDRDPARLVERAELCRPTRRPDSNTLHVATLAIMAWRQADFRTLLEGMAAKRETLVTHTEMRTFDLGDPADLEAAMALFPIARTESGRRKGYKAGAAASAATRNAISKAAADKIADRWGVKGHTALALCAEAGFTYHTMRRWLGEWKPARRRRERNAARAAKITALKEQANA